MERVRRFYPDSVFCDKDEIPDQLRSIREYVLTIREWKYEDHETMLAMRKRIQALEEEVEELKAIKNAPPDAAEGAEMAFAGLSRA